MDRPLWPLVVYALAAAAVPIGMIAISFFLGQRHREHATGESYESGIVSTGSARLRFSVKYYLVALTFVVFDLEAAFIFAWAVALRRVGWTGYIGALVFIAILLVALIYEWRQGALDWGPAAIRREPGAPVVSPASIPSVKSEHGN